MASVEVSVSVGSSRFGFEWEDRPIIMQYDSDAKTALEQLDIAYHRIRSSIKAGMKPEVVIANDR